MEHARMDELVPICGIDLSARVEILKNNPSIKSVEGWMQEYKGVGLISIGKQGFCLGGKEKRNNTAEIKGVNLEIWILSWNHDLPGL